MKKYPITVLLLAIALAGCATVISGTSQAITIDSNVQGATVSFEGNVVGSTPFTGKVPRKREAIAMVSKEGYTSQPISLTSTYNPVAILSIFWDYSTTDCLTGACWEYAPASYYVNLRRAGTSEFRFRSETSTKAYAMTYYGELITELVAGNGPKLEALRSSMFADMSSEDFIKVVSKADRGNAIVFGESVASLLVR